MTRGNNCRVHNLKLEMKVKSFEGANSVALVMVNHWELMAEVVMIPYYTLAADLWMTD